MTTNEAAERLLEQEQYNSRSFPLITREMLDAALAEERRHVIAEIRERSDREAYADMEGHPTCPFCYERGRKGAAVTEGLDVDARNALADATWLDRDGVDIEDAIKRLHRLGFTVARLSAEQPDTEATE